MKILSRIHIIISLILTMLLPMTIAALDNPPVSMAPIYLKITNSTDSVRNIYISGFAFSAAGNSPIAQIRYQNQSSTPPDFTLQPGQSSTNTITFKHPYAALIGKSGISSFDSDITLALTVTSHGTGPDHEMHYTNIPMHMSYDTNRGVTLSFTDGGDAFSIENSAHTIAGELTISSMQINSLSFPIINVIITAS